MGLWTHKGHPPTLEPLDSWGHGLTRLQAAEAAALQKPPEEVPDFMLLHPEMPARRPPAEVLEELRALDQELLIGARWGLVLVVVWCLAAYDARGRYAAPRHLLPSSAANDNSAEWAAWSLMPH
jgi:hypothetical protein